MAATENVRAEVARRARYRCEYCGYPEAASSTPLEVDHIVPRARGGIATFDDLALCCRGCNLHKHVQTEAVDPVTAVTVRLFNPRTQQWPEHFRLERDTSAVRGLTPIGRATVVALALNSAHALATRKLLIQLGLIKTRAKPRPSGRGYKRVAPSAGQFLLLAQASRQTWYNKKPW